MSELTERFTLVFEGDIRKLRRNPFKTNSAFGRPVIASMGDVTAERDRLQALIDHHRIEDDGRPLDEA